MLENKEEKKSETPVFFMKLNLILVTQKYIFGRNDLSLTPIYHVLFSNIYIKYSERQPSGFGAEINKDPDPTVKLQLERIRICIKL